LPFDDSSFDAVVCQFGFMFFPDRVRAYREARRVLRADGHLVFNVWDRLELNPVSMTVSHTVAALFPADPPSFLKRVPFGYSVISEIQTDLKAAGFAEVTVETVVKRSRSTTAHAAEGLCMGTPLRSEIEMRDGSRLTEAGAKTTEALELLCGSSSFDQPMSAHVIVASR
jgi:SAM-dependent methyltransferase